ncbi:MAG: hypothetical protein KBS59_04035 [Clostridiales bacterium]|nr:hypothetical protein [Clostridiales bacterium]
MLKLNSIPENVFDVFDDKRAVKVNGADGSTKEITRKSIIDTGRMVACEFIGKGLGKEFNSVMKNNDYATVAKAHKEKKLLYCAAQANMIAGKEAPRSFEEVAKNPSYCKNSFFLQTLAEIDRDILDPLFFAILDDVGMGLMKWEPAELGRTAEIEIRSNDVFLFEDSAFGSGRSTSKNYLYAKSLAMTPKPFSCNATIKWYQDMVNGDAGRYYAAIMNGMYSKIYAILMRNLKAAVNGGTYIPAGLTASTYTTQNYLKITDLVAAANGVKVDNLMAIGTRSALSNLLPVDGTGGAITGLQYGLGEQWFTNGYLPKAGSVDLFPISPVIVPGTQNNELLTIDTGDDIYLLAKGAYAPMYGVYAEGSPITLTASASETADFTIDINAMALFDIAPVFASKIGVITSVYPNA